MILLKKKRKDPLLCVTGSQDCKIGGRDLITLFLSLPCQSPAIVDVSKLIYAHVLDSAFLRECYMQQFKKMQLAALKSL